MDTSIQVIVYTVNGFLYDVMLYQDVQTAQQAFEALKRELLSQLDTEESIDRNTDHELCLYRHGFVTVQLRWLQKPVTSSISLPERMCAHE
jgi:hypothetical protein